MGRGNTPGPPLREGATPSRTQPQHGLRPCAVAVRLIVYGKETLRRWPTQNFVVSAPYEIFICTSDIATFKYNIDII